jgi:ubiquinone/menaquinone biosynthesis C-methylase UbiE
VLEKYERQAQSYDNRWNRSFGGALLHACIEAVPWTRVRRVLDVGCGTGTLEQRVLSNGHPPVQIIGVDASLAMLREAKSKLNTNGHGPVSWNNALAEILPFRSASVDAVVCANSFHYYQHPVAVLMEFHRVIKPGGYLVLADWCHDFLTCKVSQWALRAAHHTGIHRYGLIRCYGMEELSRLLTSAGFHIEMSRSFEIDWGWGSMVYRARA